MYIINNNINYVENSTIEVVSNRIPTHQRLSKCTCSRKYSAPQNSLMNWIGQVEKVQRTAARWTCRRWMNIRSVGDMLDELE